MPVEVALHLLHKTLTLQSLANEGSGLVSLLPPFLQRCNQLLNAVAVHHDNMEPKCPESLLVDFSVVGVHGLLGLPECVDVNEYSQVVQLVVAGKRSRFPDAALGHLAVPSYAVYPVGDLVEVLARVGHTRGH
jgi:hypothetical protein